MIDHSLALIIGASLYLALVMVVEAMRLKREAAKRLIIIRIRK